MATRELIIDSFAGGGGASLGISRALGRAVDVAINHNAGAIEMHAANHPTTRHLTEDVFRVNPREVTKGRKVGLLWASPDCRHFSRAKGGKPVKKEIRGLAWVVIKWAAEVGPRVIVLENVREFQDWGPLCPLWRCACGWKGTEGQTKLARRKRACPRCDSTEIRETGEEVPDPARKGVTFRQFVGRLKALGYRVEYQVLNAADYGAPTHRRRLFLVARNDGQPIAWPDATHGHPAKIGRDLFSQELRPWRTAADCIDWSIPCPSIFARKKPLAEKTLKRIAMGVKRYVLDNPRPFLVRFNTEKGPTTVVQTANGAQLVAAFVAKHFSGMVGVPADTPLPTTTARGTQNQLAVANLVHMNHGEKQWSGVDEPLRTVTSGNHAALVYSFLVKYFGTAIGTEGDAPLPTATGKARFGLVTVQIDGEPYVIVDIGMRMLRPRELARAQGFPDDYSLTGTNTAQVVRIGNSVCPDVAEAIVRANCADLAERKAAA